MPRNVVTLTHPDRILFPQTGLTKREVAAYYEAVADWILPHLQDRPLTLKQCAPDVEHCRYLRHARERDVPGVRSIDIQEQHKRGRYMIVDSLDALLALVQRYIIEYHTWQATADNLEHPDRIVLDLDPGEEVPWPDLIAAVRLVRNVLEALKLDAWLKTTGGKGLHVVVPFRPEHGWEACLAFARGVATQIMQHDPDRYTITTAHREQRRGLILIDYLRNARTATAVAAYSIRARPTATISVPLAWDELSTKLDPARWTAKSLPARMRRLRSDPWRDYWRSRQRLTQAILDAVSAPVAATTGRRPDSRGR